MDTAHPEHSTPGQEATDPCRLTSSTSKTNTGFLYPSRSRVRPLPFLARWKGPGRAGPGIVDAFAAQPCLYAVARRLHVHMPTSVEANEATREAAWLISPLQGTDASQDRGGLREEIPRL